MSSRSYRPVDDELHFNMGFPRSQRIYFATLQKEVVSPLVALPKRPGNETDTESDDESADNVDEDGLVDILPWKIDLEGVSARVEAVPGPTSTYHSLYALGDGQVQ